MTFQQALRCLRIGKKVALPEWVGYWHMIKDDIHVHTCDGKDIDLRRFDDLAYTFTHTFRTDWIEVEQR